jgi:peptide/nickel transport system permease protein
MGVQFLFCRHVGRPPVLGIASAPFRLLVCNRIRSARAVGAGHARILFRHLFPNCLPPIIVVTTLGFSSAVLSAAGLSFLGLGAQPPSPEWGLQLASSRNYLQRAPWLTIFPGLAIAITVLGFNLLGDGLRDILDPRQRGLR